MASPSPDASEYEPWAEVSMPQEWSVHLKIARRSFPLQPYDPYAFCSMPEAIENAFSIGPSAREKFKQIVAQPSNRIEQLALFTALIESVYDNLVQAVNSHNFTIASDATLALKIQEEPTFVHLFRDFVAKPLLRDTLRERAFVYLRMGFRILCENISRLSFEVREIRDQWEAVSVDPSCGYPWDSGASNSWRGAPEGFHYARLVCDDLLGGASVEGTLRVHEFMMRLFASQGGDGPEWAIAYLQGTLVPPQRHSERKKRKPSSLLGIDQAIVLCDLVFGPRQLHRWVSVLVLIAAGSSNSEPQRFRSAPGDWDCLCNHCAAFLKDSNPDECKHELLNTLVTLHAPNFPLSSADWNRLNAKFECGDCDEPCSSEEDDEEPCSEVLRPAWWPFLDRHTLGLFPNCLEPLMHLQDPSLRVLVSGAVDLARARPRLELVLFAQSLWSGNSCEWIKADAKEILKVVVSHCEDGGRLVSALCPFASQFAILDVLKRHDLKALNNLVGAHGTSWIIEDSETMQELRHLQFEVLTSAHNCHNQDQFIDMLRLSNLWPPLITMEIADQALLSATFEGWPSDFTRMVHGRFAEALRTNNVLETGLFQACLQADWPMTRFRDKLVAVELMTKLLNCADWAEANSVKDSLEIVGSHVRLLLCTIARSSERLYGNRKLPLDVLAKTASWIDMVEDILAKTQLEFSGEGLPSRKRPASASHGRGGESRHSQHPTQTKRKSVRKSKHSFIQYATRDKPPPCETED